jgi:hypothetical protein
MKTIYIITCYNFYIKMSLPVEVTTGASPDIPDGFSAEKLIWQLSDYVKYLWHQLKMLY